MSSQDRRIVAYPKKEYYSKIINECNKKGMTRSNVVNEALKNYFDKK